MGLLQAIALEALSGYFPGLDPDSLRVNVLKGRVDLKDVVLTPGQVFAAAGFPFRLTHGTIGELGLRVPWASIYSAPVKVNAHHVEMHFEEVPFPESQRQVFEAFRNASRRAKNRTLAEGERAESAVTRALQKLFPMLLDRVEANISDVKLFLHFATGQVASLCFQQFKISSSESSIHGTLPKNRGDLAKVIRMKGLSVVLDDAGKENVALEETGIEVTLCLGDGVYNIDVSLQEQLKIAIDSSFEEFLYNAKNRIACWNSAAKYNRPLQTPSEDSQAWFKYALRATCGREAITRSELSVEGCRHAIASFLEYKRLHVLRLRNGYTLNPGEEEQIHKLEDLLDAEMILLLRSNTRADVMAEEVSAFATKEWLSWVFFDRRMSEDQEHLAGEIRKSLSVVERREREENETERASSSRAEALSALSKTWSSAKMSFTMKGLTIYVTNAGSELGSVLFGCTCCRAELDSSMRSYGILLTMSNFVLKDENRFIFRRGKIYSKGQDDVDASGNQSFFEARLQKPALGDDISVTLRLAPCAAVLDVTRLARYSTVMRMIRSVQECRRPDLLMSEQSKIVRKSNDTSSTSKLTLEASLLGVHLLLGNDRAAPDVATTEVWFLITLSTGTIFVNDVLSCPQIRGNCSGNIKNSASVAYQRGLQYGRSSFSTSHRVRNGQLLSASTTLSVELGGNRACLEITSLETFVTSCGVRDLLGVLRIARDSFGQLTFEAGLEEPHANQRMRRKGTGALRYSFHIDVASLRCVAQGDTSGRESRNAVTISATELGGIVRDGLLRRFTLKEANIQEDLYGGHVRVATTSRLPFGVRLECVDRSHVTFTEVDTTIASVSILLKPESLQDFVAISFRLREVAKEGLSMDTVVKPSAEKCSSPSNRPAEARPRLSFLLHDVRLECMCDGSHVLLSCQNTYVVTHRSVVSGSLDGLVFTDLSGLSGNHSVAIRDVALSIPRQPDRRALSFNLTPNSANIHLHSMQFTALRSFIERVVGMHHLLSNSIQRTTTHNDMSDVSATVTKDDTRRVPRHHAISVQGSDISLRVPLSPHESDCVCVEASQMTMTAGRDTFVFSLRKTSILTRTSTSNPIFVSATSAEELARHSGDWAVVVRGLDLDISHNFNRSTLSSELAEQKRSEWNVQVLSTAAFFVTASQVRLLQHIPQSLRSTMSTDDGPVHCHASNSSNDGGGHPDFKPMSSLPVLSSFEHFTLRLDTQGISVELLNEDNSGVVISTIARLEIDPIQLSLRKAREDRGRELETLVTRWSLTSSALRLEDRCFEIPSRRREVITTRRNSGRSQDNFIELEDACQTMPVLTVQGITRTDKDGAAKSSLEIHVKNLRIVPSPSLHERLMTFLVHSSVTSLSEQSVRPPVPVGTTGYDVEHRLSGSSREAQLYEGSSPKESRPSIGEEQVPVKKLSLKLFDVVIQIFGKGDGIGESSALLCFGSLKTSLLFAAGGGFLPGSQVRARDISVSMIWLPAAVVTAEEIVRDVVGEGKGSSDQRTFWTQTLLTKDINEPSNRSSAQPPLSVPHSLTIPRERFRWNFFRQDYDGQQLEQILLVQSAALRLPTENSDRMVLLVPVVSVDSRIQSLISFAHVISVLDFLPTFDAETEILLPPIQVSFNNFSVRVNVPTTADENENVDDVGQLRHVILRVRCTINGVVGRDISGFTATVKLRVDAIDEERGLRDQICAPCLVEIESHISHDISISVRSERLVRLVLSPLTARAITGLLLSSSQKQQKARNVRSRRRAASEESQASNQITLEARRLTLSIALRGVSVCCIAERPRVQLLRLTLREIRIVGYVPLDTHGDGEMEFVLQDLKLEDSLSWRLYGHEQWSKDSVEWANIVVGMRDISTSTRSAPPVMNYRLAQSRPSTLSRPNHDLSSRLQPVLACQVSWRFPFDHVSAHVQTRGFELNLNMAIAPTLAAWVRSVLSEIGSVHTAYASPFDRVSTNGWTQGKRIRGFCIGIDHVVIEPVNLVVATKAPPPRIQENLTRRALMWLLGSESSPGVTIRVPTVVFTGDFVGSDRFLERIRSIYVYVLTSRHIGRQLALQAPSVSRLVRVLAMSFLRRRQMNWFNGSETVLNSPRSSSLRRRKSRGLAEITVGTTPGPPLIYLRKMIAPE